MPKNQSFIEEPGTDNGNAGQSGDPSGAGQGLSGGTGDGGQGSGDDGDGDDQVAKYTDADLDKIINEKMPRIRAKIEREVREKIAEEEKAKTNQAKKLEEMNDLERAQYEAEQAKERVAELERERDLNDQMSIARSELQKSNINLSDELLGMFVSADAEETKAALDEIKELFPKAVDSAVSEALKRTPPPAGSGDTGAISKAAAFAKDYSDKMKGES